MVLLLPGLTMAHSPDPGVLSMPTTAHPYPRPCVLSLLTLWHTFISDHSVKPTTSYTCLYMVLEYFLCCSYQLKKQHIDILEYVDE